MTYTLQNIAGYDREKSALAKICEIINQREKYARMGAGLPKGVVFYGPSGTGKTLFAKVMASMCHLHMQTIDLGEAVDEGYISRRIAAAFAKAAGRKTPTMIFFDEIDKVLPDPHEEYVTDRAKSILAQLLTLIDGMTSRGNIIFVATCNRYSALPDALVRPGRIDRKIEIGLPDAASRRAIFEYYLGKTSCRFVMDSDEMAEITRGLAGAALETLINECILAEDGKDSVSRETVLNKLSELKNETLPKKNPPMTDRILAVRNIGHFVVARSFNMGHYVLNLEQDTVCNGFFDTLIADADDDDDYEDAEETDEVTNYYCDRDHRRAITVLLGGYAAQGLILGRIYDCTFELLRSVDRLLGKMSETGMLGLPLRYADDRNDYILKYTPERANEINAAFDNIIADCLAEAQGILSRNVDLIHALIPILTEHRSLSKKKCEPILSSLGGIRP